MPKLKTRKALKKRIDLRITKKKGVKKFLITKRKEGQNHFNAKESGNTRRTKRNDVAVHPMYKKVVVRSLPNA
jgi:ribosomal protein L35